MKPARELWRMSASGGDVEIRRSSAQRFRALSTGVPAAESPLSTALWLSTAVD